VRIVLTSGVPAPPSPRDNRGAFGARDLAQALEARRVVQRWVPNTYQFLALNGRWQLLATSNRFDHPYLFQLAGNPHDPRGWLRWSSGRALQVPQEPWNQGRGTTGVSYEHANGAFLVNRGPVNGRFYLIYADASELTSFAGSGHDELALARSTDLRHWSVPPH
jgi:hypothetical protein